MWLSERILYHAAKKFYRTELAQSEEMAEALSNSESYHQYRKVCLDKVLSAARQYGVDVQNQIVLDLGCSDGALTPFYVEEGARHVIGVDIDADAVEFANQHYATDAVEFRLCDTKSLPVTDATVDRIMCYDVFEHVANPLDVLQECRRVLKPGGQMLIGTWGWYHPFAPHLWSTMPVPWAHVVFSERTMLRTCRRVYQSDWYVPNMHDFDRDGIRIEDKYQHESISNEYLNKYLVRDFERVFRQSGLNFKVHSQPFSSRYAAWTRPLLKVPFLREFVTAYIWVVLERPMEPLETRLVKRQLPKRSSPPPVAVSIT